MSILRALFFLSDFGGGGAQKTILNIVGAVNTLSLEVDLVVADSRGPARSWVPEGLEFRDLGGRTGLARSIPALAKTIHAVRPDVILSTMLHANIATSIAARLARSEAAVVLRETNSHRARPDIGMVQRHLARVAYHRADLLVALSEGVRQELVKDMSLDPFRAVTIPNPVKVNGLRKQIAEARKNAPPLENWAGPTILAIGRLFPQKAHEILLDAVARHVDDARLVILGEGPERGSLTCQAERRGMADRLVMPGFVDDVTPYLAHADIFALSSRWEGFGHVLVEGMAAGLPVVSTDCPYGPADIIEHEKTGLLVPPEDADALGRALARVAKDTGFAQRLGKAGNRSTARFEARQVAKRYVEVLHVAASLRASSRQKTNQLHTAS